MAEQKKKRKTLVDSALRSVSSISQSLRKLTTSSKTNTVETDSSGISIRKKGDNRSKLEILKSQAIASPEDECGMEKSVLDDREYRFVKLDNEMEVVLISDAKTETSAAALSMNVGSFSDPKECPGLAHFLEHMLFMGTEKYPDESLFMKHLSQNGGYSNAYTADEETNYQFSVKSEELKSVLDMFAQFFIAPLFDQSSTDRELQAVDNECSKNLQNDYWRKHSVLKAVSNPQHPFSMFGIGNIETLRDTPNANGVNVREYLLEFYEKYYSANLMKLVIMGRENLDTLEEWAREMFTDVKNKNLTTPYVHPNPSGPAFTEENLGLRVDIVPVKEQRLLKLTWLLDGPTNYKMGNSDACSYLGSLIGDEGEGSILSLLKKKAWANGLSAGASARNFDFTFFDVTVSCTEEGILNHVEDIISTVYAYVGLIKQNWEKMKWYYDQEAELQVVNYRFSSAPRPFEYVTHIASIMHEGYPSKSLLTASSLYDGSPISKISEALDAFVPERSLVSVSHRSVEEYADKTERWFSVKYSSNSLKEEDILAWKNVKSSDMPELALPPKNQFIPLDFSLKDFKTPGIAKLDSDVNTLLKLRASSPEILSLKSFNHSQVLDKKSFALETTTRDITQKWEDDTWRPPVLLQANDTSHLWYKHDVTFQRPIATVRVMLKTDTLNDSPRTNLLVSLYSSMISDLLTEQTYPAMMAGLSYGASFDENGIYLNFSGYNDKLEDYMKFVSTNIRTPKGFEESAFNRFIETINKSLENYSKGEPYRMAYGHLDYSTSDRGWTVLEKQEALKTISFQDVVGMEHKIFDNLALEMSVFGNASQEDAKSYMKTIKSVFSCKNKIKNATANHSKTVKLSPRTQYYMIHPTLDLQNPNSSIVIGFQMGAYSREESALLSVLSAICGERYFDDLRTQQQLGYIVASQKTLKDGVLGLAFIVQSNSKDPLYLEARTEEFIDNFEKSVMEMTAEDFDTNVNSYINKLLASSKTLSEEERKWAGDIQSELYDFSAAIKLASIIAKLSVDDLKTLYSKYLSKDAPLRSKMVSGVIADAHAKALLGDDYTIPENVNNSIVAFGADVLQEAVQKNQTLDEDGNNIRGDIVFIENKKLFREAAEFYPTFVEMHETLE